MIYFQSFRVDATAAGTFYDDGLRSTAENPKKLLSILVQAEKKPTADAQLQVWYEKEKIADLPLELFDSPAAGIAEAWSFNRLNELEIGFDIPVGATVKVAVKSTATLDNILGAYRYEITA
ncbi:hypothetical protein ES708_11813 [subsurface metagenome]